MKLQCTEAKLNRAIKLYGFKGVHPALNVIPMMNDREYTALCADVKKHGFLHAVVVNSEGYLIDGRARLCASIEEHITKDAPVERRDPVDTMAYVYDVNVARQHLTPKQVKESEKAAKVMEKEQRQKEAFWAGISEG